LASDLCMLRPFARFAAGVMYEFLLGRRS
jgi:hypothetical protein